MLAKWHSVCSIMILSSIARVNLVDLESLMLNFKCFSHRIGIVGTKGSSREVMWPTGAGRTKSHRHGTYLDQPTQLPLASPSGLSQGAVFSHMCVSREGVLGALVTPARQTRAETSSLFSPPHARCSDGQLPPSLGVSIRPLSHSIFSLILRFITGRSSKCVLLDRGTASLVCWSCVVKY